MKSRIALVFMLCVERRVAAVFANRNFVPDWTFKGSSLAGLSDGRSRGVESGERRNRWDADLAGGRMAVSRQVAAGRAICRQRPLPRRLYRRA